MELKDVKIIMECQAGSYLYGTNLEDSDIDMRGVFIAPKSCYLGLDNVEQIENKTNDSVYYELKKFLRLAAQNNPNIIELLFYPKNKLTVCTPEWETIVDNRELFISKKCMYTFSGYAFAQLKKTQCNRKSYIENKDEYLLRRNDKRRCLEEQFGYDTKYAYHIQRLIEEGKELLTTGTITLPRPNAQELLDIRNGKLTYDEFMNKVQDFETEFKDLYDKSPLQYSANLSKISSICQNIIQSNLY